MKRFIFLFILGALLIVAGQVALSLGIHPEHFASLHFFARSGLALVLGSAIVASGMMGLADGYEKNAAQLSQLLTVKQPDPDHPLAVEDSEALAVHNRSFWAAYRNSALAICLFLAGLFAVALLLEGTGFLLYLIGLSAGVAVWGFPALALGGRALHAVRQTHRTVEDSTQHLAAQPDRPTESPPSGGSRIQWQGIRQRPSRYGRRLDPLGRTTKR
ncbi:MAG: hypothetical protein HOC74_33280 [Gemmatimonadetes bacterium]|nr:hypothetical protein [Gemmatimonadota bacterium]